MGETSTIFDYIGVNVNESGWSFPFPSRPLTVQLSDEYSIGSRIGLEMLDWLIQHKIEVNPYNVDSYTYDLRTADVKFEFILTWS